MSSTKKSLYSIIRSPIITEKASILSAVNNTFVFKVHRDASKTEIEHAVEKLFDVKVAKVRTINNLGKIKRVGTKLGKKPASKKAYVSLEKGYKIELVEGL